MDSNKSSLLTHFGFTVPNRRIRRLRYLNPPLISNTDTNQQLSFLGEREDSNGTDSIVDASFIPCVLPPKCCRNLNNTNVMVPNSPLSFKPPDNRVMSKENPEFASSSSEFASSSSEFAYSSPEFASSSPEFASSSPEFASSSRTNQFHLPDYCEVYTVAYNSPERAAQMTERFSKIGLPLNVHTGVQMYDPRLRFAGEDLSAKRLASVFYGHLDNIARFYETGKPFGLFCEDDVHIHKDLGKELPIIMGEFNAMKLDILLLGYMTTKTIEWWQHGYPLVYDGGLAPYRYHRYPHDQWGIHLFMISRTYAKTLMEVYGSDYAEKAHTDPSMTCCNPDWTLSKYTSNRALRYPMLAVEDGKGNYDHHGQGEFHRESHRKNYREGELY